MKDHLEVLLNELKSAQLIIKILQEEIKSTPTSPGNQDNLTNCVEYKSYKEYHTTKRKDIAWKEIWRNKHSTIQSKKTNCAGQQNSYIPLSKNRFEPISNYQLQDPPLNYAHTKCKPMQQSRNSVQNKRGIVLIGDSQVRVCSDKLSDRLGSSCNTFGVTKPNANLRAITNSINLKVENLTKKKRCSDCLGWYKGWSQGWFKNSFWICQAYSKHKCECNVCSSSLWFAAIFMH